MRTTFLSFITISSFIFPALNAGHAGVKNDDDGSAAPYTLVRTSSSSTFFERHTKSSEDLLSDEEEEEAGDESGDSVSPREKEPSEKTSTPEEIRNKEQENALKTLVLYKDYIQDAVNLAVPLEMMITSQGGKPSAGFASEMESEIQHFLERAESLRRENVALFADTAPTADTFITLRAEGLKSERTLQYDKALRSSAEGSISKFYLLHTHGPIYPSSSNKKERMRELNTLHQKSSDGLTNALHHGSFLGLSKEDVMKAWKAEQARLLLKDRTAQSVVYTARIMESGSHEDKGAALNLWLHDVDRFHQTLLAVQ